jgi:hypothetical protein
MWPVESFRSARGEDTPTYRGVFENVLEASKALGHTQEEAYGMFFGFKAFKCLLKGKDFIIKTEKRSCHVFLKILISLRFFLGNRIPTSRFIFSNLRYHRALVKVDVERVRRLIVLPFQRLGRRSGMDRFYRRCRCIIAFFDAGDATRPTLNEFVKNPRETL